MASDWSSWMGPRSPSSHKWVLWRLFLGEVATPPQRRDFQLFSAHIIPPIFLLTLAAKGILYSSMACFAVSHVHSLQQCRSGPVCTGGVLFRATVHNEGGEVSMQGLHTS